MCGSPLGYGQHLEHVGLRAPVGRLVADLPGPLALPHLLPARLDGVRVVAVLGGHRTGEDSRRRCAGAAARRPGSSPQQRAMSAIVRGHAVAARRFGAMTDAPEAADGADPPRARPHLEASRRVAQIMRAAEDAAAELRMEAERRADARIAEASRAAENRVAAAEEEATELRRRGAAQGGGPARHGRERRRPHPRGRAARGHAAARGGAPAGRRGPADRRGLRGPDARGRRGRGAQADRPRPRARRRRARGRHGDEPQPPPARRLAAQERRDAAPRRHARPPRARRPPRRGRHRRAAGVGRGRAPVTGADRRSATCRSSSRRARDPQKGALSSGFPSDTRTSVRVVNSTLKGAIAEQAVILEATRLGIDAMRPSIDGRRYDLVLDTGEPLPARPGQVGRAAGRRHPGEHADESADAAGVREHDVHARTRSTASPCTATRTASATGSRSRRFAGRTYRSSAARAVQKQPAPASKLGR